MLCKSTFIFYTDSNGFSLLFDLKQKSYLIQLKALKIIKYIASVIASILIIIRPGPPNALDSEFYVA